MSTSASPPSVEPHAAVSTTPAPQGRSKSLLTRLRPRRLISLVLLVALIVIGLPYVLGWIDFRRTHSMTEDAFVEAHIVNVAPEIVSGRIIRFLADENDQVSQGQVVAEVDPTPYRDKVNLARSGLESAQAEARSTASRPCPRSQRGSDPDRDCPADSGGRRGRPWPGRGVCETDSRRRREGYR